jgi:glycosyltransferase involved in cell wall biosynthesis
MHPKPTIVFVANTAWSMYNFRRGLLVSLINEGYNVAVVAPEDDFIVNLTNLKVKCYPLITIRNHGINPFQDLQLLAEFRKLYKKIKPALVFHYTIKPNIYGTIAASQLGIPSIAVTTGLGYAFTHQNLVSAIVKQLYRYALCKASEVWFLNGEDAKVFLQQKIIQSSQAVVLNGEGVNTQYFSPSKKPSVNLTKKFILVARLIYDKGVEEYAEAAAILQKKGYRFECQVLGFFEDKNPKAISRQQIIDWQNRGLIKYLGVTTDVRPYLEAADCLVLPSYYGEGMPRTLMEAASLAKPIIATDHTGCREVVDDDRSGFLCRIKDAEDLAAKMEAIINMTAEDLMIMGANGRVKMIAEFDEKIVIETYKRTISKYIMRKPVQAISTLE